MTSMTAIARVATPLAAGLGLATVAGLYSTASREREWEQHPDLKHGDPALAGVGGMMVLSGAGLGGLAIGLAGPNGLPKWGAAALVATGLGVATLGGHIFGTSMVDASRNLLRERAAETPGH